ncbi:DNA cytosine methyltransferase [Streptomyces sp. NPDC051563]|uniref:DNA cytosine methyltransferase n=1 Tax=Streptomyces sp. NPDC051563 TaxID=3365659 RepID=UPI00378B8B53
MSLTRLDTAGALGVPDDLDLSGKTPEELAEIAAPWPAHWLSPPKPGDPDRVVNLFAGPGGWDVGVRDVLQHELDIVGVEMHKGASATACAAGFRRITADVRSLNPKHPALRWVRGLIVSAPCQCWSPAGKRAGLDPRNQELLLDIFTAAFEATFGHWHDSADCGACEVEDICLICNNPDWDGYAGFTGPLLTLDEVRAPIADMTDERIGLVAEVLIWALTLTAQWDNLRWLAMEQSSALPELILDGLREELWSADWCSAEYRVLDAVDYGLASRRKRVFLMAARHAYVDMDALTPKAPMPATAAAQALGWPEGIRVNTRGFRKTAGGNCWSADKPATGITSKIRGWYWEHDKDRTFSLDEAALLVGFRPGYPWTGSRSSCTQQIGDVVAPPMSAVVIGSLLSRHWEDHLRRYLADIYTPTLTPAEPVHVLAA